MNSEDDLIFADDEGGADAKTSSSIRPGWKVMIVDDEPAVHDVTRLALAGVTFGGRAIDLISCFSGKEALETIRQNPDVSLMLLDVVMETDHAGLDVARQVRQDLDNQMVRIVLRTGQPGQAPERSVITDYDINDYKEKTELTANKLFTLVYASLRAYQYILTVEQGKKGLAKIIEASADIFKLSSLDRFARGVLEQLSALLQINPEAILMQQRQPVHLNGVVASFAGDRWQPIAGIGRYEAVPGEDLLTILGAERLKKIEKVTQSGGIFSDQDDYIVYFVDRLGNQNLLLIEGVQQLGQLERDLVELFVRNVSIAFENVYLHADLDETQREIIFLLGEAVEVRSQETGNHVRRVAEISRILAEEVGLSEREADLVQQASPLHDLGKIGIPDHILNKPGGLNPEELAIMRGHAEIGYRMLAGSHRKMLQAAAHIAHEHHERWDGKGYPRGLSGENIHCYGRITAVADVFDALLSDRCYKKAWPLEDVLDFLRTEKGTQFDPGMIDALFARLDDILAVRNRLPDLADPVIGSTKA
ncbi:MAG: hypothetical protein RLZZ561_1993 [Pseudomonadota bacterium]|jgi:response regulator RpfG family c-di-GMP phosphodiesterase